MGGGGAWVRLGLGFVEVQVAEGGVEMGFHGSGSCGRVAGFEGFLDEGVVFDGWPFADVADGAEAAFEAEVGEGIEDEGEDLVTAGGGDKVMPFDIGVDGFFVGHGVCEALVGGAGGEELIVRGVLCGESGGGGFDGAPSLVELAETAREVGDEEGEGIAEGAVELSDDFDAGAVLNFEEALLFEALGCFAYDGATDTQLLSEGSFGREPSGVVLVVVGLAEDEVGEARADFFDEGRGTLESAELHGRLESGKGCCLGMEAPVGQRSYHWALF